MWDPQFVLLCGIPKLRGDYIIIIVAGKTFPKYTKPRKYYLTEFIHYTVYIIILSGVHPHLHGIGQHSGEAEWDLLRELLSGHGYFKTVSKVNVKDTSSQSVQHEVGGVSGAKEGGKFSPEP